MYSLSKEQKDILKKPVKRGIILEALKEIEVDNGILTPHNVVEAARGEDHPLHKNFTWDNDLAGDKFRLFEARVLINSVRVEIMGEKREAYLNVVTKVNSVATRGYVSIEAVMSDEDLHKQVVLTAIREVEYWKRKFDSLSEMKGIVNPKKLEQVKKKYLDEEEK